MAGAWHEPVSRKRICYSCGTCYPETVRFCPLDGSDLENPPEPMVPAARGFNQTNRRILRVLRSGILSLLLIAAGFMLNSVVRSIAPDAIGFGDLTVRTTPSGASVYLDGAQVGTSPLRLSDIPTGVHEIRAAFPGYQDSRAKVEIIPSATRKLSWSLSPLRPNPEGSDRTRFIAELPR